jgi:HK97 gp10 family phage protein
MPIHFVDNIIGKLSELENKAANKVTRKALRAGAKVIQTQAQANAPVKSGLLKKSIKVRAGKSRKGIISIIVGVGKKWFTGPSFYAAFVEFGHKTGKRRSRGKVRARGDSRKEIPGKHFIEQAFGESKEAALGEIERAYRELLP